MIFLLSPAKKLVCEGLEDRFDSTTPMFEEQAAYLVSKLQKKSARQLSKMMGISDDLARLNYERYQNWESTNSIESQAALMFKGDVYLGMQAEKWNKKDFNYAQEHVRILSGLYGLLRPLDAVRAYRLEMGSSFQVTPAKKNLYAFWQDGIKEQVEEDSVTDKTIVDLASKEYSKAAKLAKMERKVITPVFKDEHKGEYRSLQFFVKKARGMMADFAVKNKIQKVEDLKSFDREDYVFSPSLSNENDWVFTRDKKNR